MFKIGTDFYDFTKFKLVDSTWFAATYIQGTNSTQEIYNFGWCQLLEETQAPKNCSGSYYAGGLLPTRETNSTECTAYSGSEPDNIETMALENVNVTI
jgi:hypothetical protein